jgi:hypothetical protein
LIAHSLHVFSAPVHVPCDALLAIFACENEQLSRENNCFCRKIVLIPQQRFPALNSVSKTRRAMKPAAIPKPATNMIVPPVGSLFNPLNCASHDRSRIPDSEPLPFIPGADFAMCFSKKIYSLVIMSRRSRGSYLARQSTKPAVFK